jgi:hypothetical protein
MAAAEQTIQGQNSKNITLQNKKKTSPIEMTTTAEHHQAPT